MRSPLFLSIYGNVNGFLSIVVLWLGLALAGIAGVSHAEAVVDPHASANDFVQSIGNNALNAVRQDSAAKQGDLRRINELIDHYLLPYVNFEKTTRLAAGPHWRKATPQQRKDLVAAFRGTLLRTYGGALADVDQIDRLQTLPFRGDPNANDVVVRSTFIRRNGPAVAVDYRLEKTSEGWKIYDVNVEGIWLIQTYRNQFTQQINQSGIDGLIATLNEKNQ